MDVRPSLCSGRQKADCGYPPSKSARSLNYRTGILGSYKRIIMYKRTPDAQKIYEIQKILKHKGFLGTDDKGSCFCSSHFLSSNHYLGVKENRNLANRRRRRQKPNQMVWIMLAITMVCVVIVFAIVMAQKEKGALVKQAKAVTKDMVYENAYIVSNDDGRLIFICDGDLYRAKGTMEENFTGVCDIEISGSKVKKIQIKPDDISGVMLSYGDGTMQIAGQGDIPMQSDKLPVYDETGTSPKEIAVSDLIIGSETLSYILDSGRICASSEDRHQTLHT